MFRWYAKVGGPVTFAGRLIVDLMAGNVPFYDLSQGGAFIPIDLPGGAGGVRGVPNGRYQGLIKAVANVELRFTHLRFRLFGDDFRIGNNIFFDTGRVFSKFGPDPRDGTGLGLKYGVGAGALWWTWAAPHVQTRKGTAPSSVSTASAARKTMTVPQYWELSVAAGRGVNGGWASLAGSVVGAALLPDPAAERGGATLLPAVAPRVRPRTSTRPRGTCSAPVPPD